MTSYDRPILVFMAGLPGTGKSTLANAIGAAARWPVIDKDTINTTLLHAGLGQTLAGPLAYAVLFDLVHDLLVTQQLSVVINTAGRQHMVWDHALAVAMQANARIKVVRCIAPCAVRAARLAQRDPRPSQLQTDQATDHDQETWYAHLPPETLVVTTVDPLSTYVDRVLGFVCAT